MKNEKFKIKCLSELSEMLYNADYVLTDEEHNFISENYPGIYKYIAILRRVEERDLKRMTINKQDVNLAISKIFGSQL